MPLVITEVMTKGILIYIPQIGTIKLWLSKDDSRSVVQSAASMPLTRSHRNRSLGWLPCVLAYC